MPLFYAAYIWDAFSDMKLLIGVFDTIGRAEEAIDIVIRQCKKDCPDNTPDGRFGWYWDKVRVNEFNIEELCDFLY